MQTLQQKIDNAFRNRISEHWTAHQVNKALQEFREQIDSLEIHSYKVGNDYFIGISFHRVMELLGEQTNA